MFFTPRKISPVETQALLMDLLDAMATLQDPKLRASAGDDLRKQYELTDEQRAAHTQALADIEAARAGTKELAEAHAELEKKRQAHATACGKLEMKEKLLTGRAAEVEARFVEAGDRLARAKEYEGVLAAREARLKPTEAALEHRERAVEDAEVAVGKREAAVAQREKKLQSALAMATSGG